MPVRVIPIREGRRVDSNRPKELTALKIRPNDMSLVDKSNTESNYTIRENLGSFEGSLSILKNKLPPPMGGEAPSR